MDLVSYLCEEKPFKKADALLGVAVLERRNKLAGLFFWFLVFFPPRMIRVTACVRSSTFSRKELLFCVINGNIQDKTVVFVITLTKRSRFRNEGGRDGSRPPSTHTLV